MGERYQPEQDLSENWGEVELFEEVASADRSEPKDTPSEKEKRLAKGLKIVLPILLTVAVLAPKGAEAVQGLRERAEIERADDAKLKDARVEKIDSEVKAGLEDQGFSAAEIQEIMSSEQYREATKILLEEEPEDFVSWLENKLDKGGE